MKKILAALLAVSMIATPAMAEHRDRGDGEHHGRRGGGCGWLCGAVIGGLVVGALSSSSREQERDRYERDYDNRYYPPDIRYDRRRYCVREQIVEWRYGERYVYWQTTCN